MLTLNFEHLIDKIDFAKYQSKVNAIDEMIEKRTGPGNDFLGWLRYPETYDKEELEEIIKSAAFVRENFEVLVVCGIGGSYLGARAGIEALKGLHPRDKIEIIFLGQTFSSDYIYETLEYVKDKKFAINVISKSGTTTETAISFRLLKELLESKVGKEEARKAIFATTDKEKGALKTLSTQEGYKTFVLPGDVGGRFSVFTAVGLFPMAVAGIDVRKVLKGAHASMEENRGSDLTKNKAYQYAIVRDTLLRKGYPVEMFVTYEPRLVQLGEWFKQLFGESEGKEHKGLLPDSATFSTDLHSLGQFIQDGSPVLFETILFVNKPRHEVVIPEDKENLDGLNYLAGKNLAFVNEKAYIGTLAAHEETGRVPNMLLNLDKLDEFELGYILYFFMKTCAMSGYLLEVNPFNQPGVEVYKKNMFHLLGKKGY